MRRVTINNSLQNPVWDGEKWSGINKELDFLSLLEALAIQMAQYEARLALLEGGDTEDV